MTVAHMSRRILNDAEQAFEVLILEPTEPRAVVLFAVGGGDDPDRHLTFLQSIAAEGYTVVAPRFARLASPAPSLDELATRARRLRLAFDEMAQPHIPGAGLGHSVGGALLLVLAGARAFTLAGETLQVQPERRLRRLALMAPATDFFRAPDALNGTHASIAIWAGTRDEITPAETAQFLGTALEGIAPVIVHAVPGAGHFSFMNAPPPHATEFLPDRDAFLERLAAAVADFVGS